MKKFVLSLVLIVFITPLFAQYNQEELLKEMQKMQEEMMKNFESLEYNFGDSQLLIDTFFVKEFQPFGEMAPMQPFSGDATALMELLQQQLQQMDSDDWAEMEKLFEAFGGFSPMVPTPENRKKEQQEEGDIKHKSNKKRKSYTL